MLPALFTFHFSLFTLHLKRAVAHARGGAEGSQGCREDADDDLQDGLPSFLLHSAFMVFLGVCNCGGSLAGAEPPPIA